MLNWIHEVRADWLLKRSRYQIALADMPPRVFTFWQGHAAAEFEGIPRDAFFYARASEGLMDFFTCIEQAEGKACALPSKAADSVWHAWRKVDPLGLDHFTLKHFRQRIPHVEAGAMVGGMGAALGRSLVLNRGIHRMQPEGPGVPPLFALDGQLNMPHGYGYRMRKGELGYALLDHSGRAGNSMLFPPALAVAGLLDAGFITTEQYQAALMRRNGDGAACGATAGSDRDNDGDGGDGGDGGSGCGGGCGSS